MSTSATTKTDLLQLGLLLDRPMHGYELYQQIQAEGIDGWFNISAAGVYYSLGKLRERGLVAESGRSGGRSSRKSVYRLTEKGRTVFFEALEAELDCQDQTYLDYDLAVYFLNRLPVQRAIPQLQKHQDFLAEQAQELKAILDGEQGNGSSSLRLAVLDHRRRFLEMEQAWLDDVICTIQEESEVCHAEGAIQRGLMRLSGDLADYHLPDLVRLIVAGRHTGTLTVTDGAEIRTLSFEDGQPVYASYVQWGEPSTPLTACEQVLDGLCELFRWQEGQFAFDQRMVPRDQCVPLECSAEDLILRGCRKVDDWVIIQRLVPSADTIFELGSAVPHVDLLNLTATEERVATAVDGVKDVAAIARELDLTLFETSRAVYCLAAVGVLRTASMDKTRMRRVFREIAELMCNSTLAWRSDPEDRSCEEEVNALVEAQMPICLQGGRIQDQVDPQLSVDQLQGMYRRFLQAQYAVVSSRFGRSNARQAFERTLHQLAPELQAVAKRYGFDRLTV
jgi:DNA-binding PadR family transcriptional regulator